MNQTAITGTSTWGGLGKSMAEARAWVESQLDGWAEKYAWTSADLYTAEDDVEAAAQAADAAAFFGDDPATFWQELADRAAFWPSGDQLAPIWQSAGATVVTVDEASYDWQDYGQDMLDDAAYGIEQVEGVAEAGAKAARMPAAWGIGAGVAALGLAAYLLA